MSNESRSESEDAAFPDTSTAAVREDVAVGEALPVARTRRSGAEAGLAAAGAERAEPERGPASAGEASFGTWLRRQRELREIDLREIADKTKISLRYLKAMEQDRFEVLPAPVFARGFLREYAKYVGLNPDEVVNYYLTQEGLVEEREPEADDRPTSSAARGPVTRGAFLILLLIVVVAAAAYFLFWRRAHEEAARAAPPPIAVPAQVEVPRNEVPPPPPAEPEVTAPVTVTLDFTQECWVEAETDGKPSISRRYVAGESLRLEAQQSVVLTTLGNAGGVEVQVNGMPFDLRAESGEVLHDVTIDLETVERLRRRAA